MSYEPNRVFSPLLVVVLMCRGTIATRLAALTLGHDVYGPSTYP